MPLDILGRTRATMACAKSLFEIRLERTNRLVFKLQQCSLDIGGKVTLVSESRETVVERLRQS